MPPREAQARRALLELVESCRPFPWLDALAHRLLGQTTGALGDLAQARLHLQRSVEVATAASARYELALTHLAIAELENDCERREAAHACIARLGVRLASSDQGGVNC